MTINMPLMATDQQLTVHSRSVTRCELMIMANTLPRRPIRIVGLVHREDEY